jgi:hypothetical protein
MATSLFVRFLLAAASAACAVFLAIRGYLARERLIYQYAQLNRRTRFRLAASFSLSIFSIMFLTMLSVLLVASDRLNQVLPGALCFAAFFSLLLPLILLRTLGDARFSARVAPRLLRSIAQSQAPPDTMKPQVRVDFGQGCNRLPLRLSTIVLCGVLGLGMSWLISLPEGLRSVGIIQLTLPPLLGLIVGLAAPELLETLTKWLERRRELYQASPDPQDDRDIPPTSKPGA